MNRRRVPLGVPFITTSASFCPSLSGRQTNDPCSGILNFRMSCGLQLGRDFAASSASRSSRDGLLGADAHMMWSWGHTSRLRSSSAR